MITVAVVAAMAATVGVVLLTSEAPTYSIEYVLDGGTLSEDSPSSYKSGTITELGSASKKIENSKDNYYFLGWYLDEGLTQNIMYIPSNMTGNLKLYASWSEDCSGAQEFFNTKTTVTQETMRGTVESKTTGTYDRTLLCYSEQKKTYLEMVSYTQTDSSNRTTGNTVVKWMTFIDTGDDDDLELKPDTLVLGNRTISCESVSFTYEDGNCDVSEKRYFLYGWAMLYSVADYTPKEGVLTLYSGKTETFELRSLGTYPISDTYEIGAYADKGINVTNAGIYDSFTTNITLTATADQGYEFGGWYDGAGNLLSSSPTYTVDVLLSDITIFASNTESKDVVLNVDDSYNLSDDRVTDITWHIYDSDMNEVLFSNEDALSYVFDECGAYTITYIGSDAEGDLIYRYYSLFVDGVVTRSFEWRWNGVDYHYDLDIRYSDFFAYRNDSSVIRSAYPYYKSMVPYAQVLITSDDPYVVELANMLIEKTEGMTEYDRINMLLAFTQYIEYVSDPESMGLDEYWKYPLETLYDNNGDCEDTSILFAAIGKAMGYDTGVMVFTGHATGAINFTELGMSNEEFELSYQSYGSVFNSKKVYTIAYYDKTQYLYENDGKGYFYCETTTPENDAGMEFVLGVDPNAGNKTRNPVRETYSPYNMLLFIPAA